MFSILRFVGFVVCMTVSSICGGIVAVAVSGAPMANCNANSVCSYVGSWVGVRQSPATLAGQTLNCLDKRGLAKLNQFTAVIAYPSRPSEDSIWTKLHADGRPDCVPLDKAVAAVCKDVGGGGASPQDCDQLPLQGAAVSSP
jgi:hypothetical protein